VRGRPVDASLFQPGGLIPTLPASLPCNRMGQNSFSWSDKRIPRTLISSNIRSASPMRDFEDILTQIGSGLVPSRCIFILGPGLVMQGYTRYKILSVPISINALFLLLYHRNLDACARPAPRDPAPLLLRPAQARLNFGSGPAHPAHPADRTVAEPRVQKYAASSPRSGPRVMPHT
jgi:hypothetical protein